MIYDGHKCPLCGRSQIYYMHTWLCPRCNSLEIEELSIDRRMIKDE